MIMAAMMIMMTSAADAQTEKKLTNFNDTTFTHQGAENAKEATTRL